MRQVFLILERKVVNLKPNLVKIKSNNLESKLRHNLFFFITEFSLNIKINAFRSDCSVTVFFLLTVSLEVKCPYTGLWSDWVILVLFYIFISLLFDSRISGGPGLLWKVLRVKLVGAVVVPPVRVQPGNVDAHHLVLFQRDVGPGDGVGNLAVAHARPVHVAVPQRLVDDLVEVGKILGRENCTGELTHSTQTQTTHSSLELKVLMRLFQGVGWNIKIVNRCHRLTQVNPG